METDPNGGAAVLDVVNVSEGPDDFCVENGAYSSSAVTLPDTAASGVSAGDRRLRNGGGGGGATAHDAIWES